MLLSAALIVRNEAQVLGPCLESLRSLADEIVVVDTGSIDRTKEIAQETGARLFEFEWIGNYSAARNEALRHCRGDWILSVDADERYHPCDARRLQKELEDESKIAYTVTFRIRSEFTPYRRIRLYRNDPNIRFQGIIHENVLESLDRLRAQAGGEIGEGCLSADHVGYDGDQREKNRRNLPLLLECVRCEPERVLVWCHIANAYASLGIVDQADLAWERAVEVTEVRRHRHVGLYDSVAYLGLIEWRMKRGLQVDDLLAEAVRTFPENLHLSWFKGRRFMAHGNYEEAIPCFETLIDCGRREDFDRSFGNSFEDFNHSFGYDSRLFHLFSYESLATCHFLLGQYTKSRQYFQLIEQSALGTRAHRVKAALCSYLESRSR